MWERDWAIASAYIHLPFCRRRCFYCDFPIVVVGDRPDSPSIPAYLGFLQQEIHLTAQRHPPHPLETVFFGGGTPSLVAPAQLGEILQQLDQTLGLAQGVEIAMEIDPGTFDLGRLRDYRAVGVNRFSLGVQAFQDELLASCGRSHNLADVETALGYFHQAQIENFSLDLISGLPDQTLGQWEESLRRAIAHQPHHLSCYDLVLEPVTPFGKRYEPGTAPLPEDMLTAQMYRTAQALLTAAGYDHYEISNYAQPGHQCRHNRTYWENRPYYAFGLGAASYTPEGRFTRPRTRADYFAWVEAGAMPVVEEVGESDRLLETLMLGLRLTEGIAWERFTPVEQAQIRATLAPYAAQGWVNLGGDGYASADGYANADGYASADRLALTDPEGLLFSNTILASLFAQFDP
ncbi:radical SAM family heme chaperone HemW [Spirulina sp. CCNP1310]|uniref:radical SAM family heme chaperone HemW n=1 Tax=Spirulina sp. CCNP1310 TaxID=3110249 RepID=UPI002B205166|nr:radical SAM family heme chaperone HemW [Spirulina sp. CCNP1310]MEA5420414.1 radical SAM family heme chaperone HemW [Spirulina sp. CCNP1310]